MLNTASDRFASYRETLLFTLIEQYKWNKDSATEYLRDHIEFIAFLFDKRMKLKEAALLLHELRNI
jgi:hypothetical protein